MGPISRSARVFSPRITEEAYSIARTARPGSRGQHVAVGPLGHMAGRGLVQQLPGSLRSSALARCPSQNSILYNSLMTFRS